MRRAICVLLDETDKIGRTGSRRGWRTNWSLWSSRCVVVEHVLLLSSSRQPKDAQPQTADAEVLSQVRGVVVGVMSQCTCVTLSHAGMIQPTVT